MTTQAPPSPEAIRAEQAANPKMRDRDLAAKLGIAEAQLVAAHTGLHVTKIDANPDRIIPLVTRLGPVMGLTRNESCVIEKDGVYDKYQSGAHAGMVLNDAIDLRLFPSHWVSAYAVEKPVEDGVRRSLQVFDAAGDAVHKIFLRPGSEASRWDDTVGALMTQEQEQTLDVGPRAPVETPKGDPDKADRLRADWAQMTDTHQFLRIVSRLKMNRLGAYRIAGEPLARPLSPSSITAALTGARDAGTEIMVFVGNRGCIEIHGGPVVNLKAMGPWQNVLDEGFNLHLREDHIAEVWAVNKPTRHGDAISVEAFDAEGSLILQIFGRRAGERDWRAEWDEIVRGLPAAVPEVA